MFRIFRAIIPLILFGCMNTGKPFNEVEPNALPANVTWSEHVYPVLRQRCNECHSSGTESKYGTVEGIDYAKYENAIPAVAVAGSKDYKDKGFQGILKEAINSSSMPPGDKDKLTPYERALLLKWQDQGFAR